jgi:hypothetical protein
VGGIEKSSELKAEETISVINANLTKKVKKIYYGNEIKKIKLKSLTFAVLFFTLIFISCFFINLYIY